MTGRVRRVIAALFVLLLIAAAGASAWSRVAFHEWPWQDHPDRVHTCGRDFEHADGATGAGPYTEAYVVAQGAKQVRSWPTLRGERAIWAASPCGLGVFVRTGADRFLGYGLVGGP